MSWIQTRRRAQEAPAGRPMEDTLRRQMAWAAGTEQFQHRDPLYHVTESFQQTFDAIGRRHARQLAGGRTEEGAEERADQTSGENQMPDPTSARSFYERSRPEDQDMVRRFSETAFQRGTLSGAVLEGTGQMMLFSCLKKTVGQSQPDKWQQRKLFEKASPMRNVPGHSPASPTAPWAWWWTPCGTPAGRWRTCRTWPWAEARWARTGRIPCAPCTPFWTTAGSGRCWSNTGSSCGRRERAERKRPFKTPPPGWRPCWKRRPR